MKVSGTFYVFSEGTNWMCHTKDVNQIRLVTYLLVFSDFDSGRISVNAGLVNAASQDLELSEEEIRATIAVLSDSVLFPKYSLYQEGDHDPRYVLEENEYYVNPACFWHGSYDGRKRFMQWFAHDISAKRTTELRRLGVRETQWLIEPLDAEYKQALEDKYQKKKWLEERRKQAAEKRKKTLAEKHAAKERVK